VGDATCAIVEEYLRAERRAIFKSEYFGGEICGIAGARPRHTRMATNLTGRLRMAP
jgi:hypothetical protein